MRHNANKTNKAVMYGVMGMAVVVMLVVLLFLGFMGSQKSIEEEENVISEITDGNLSDSVSVATDSLSL